MKLCGVSLSPYYERALLVAEAKGQLGKIEQPGIPGGFKSEQHYKDNPLGLIPYLIRDDKRVIPEGQVISEYLNVILEGVPLMPADPNDAADVSTICRILDLYVMKALWPMLMAGVFWERHEDQLRQAIDVDWPYAVNALEHFLPGTTYAIGERITLADLAFIPMIWHIDNVCHQFGCGFFDDKPKIKNWILRLKALKRLEACHERMTNSRLECQASAKERKAAGG